MLHSLMMVFVPMLLGYCIHTQNKYILNISNQILSLTLYAILLVMGMALGQLEQLTSILPQIVYTTLVFSCIIHICNLISLISFDYLFPSTFHSQAHTGHQSYWKVLLNNMQLCIIILIGFVIGWGSKDYFSIPLDSSTYILMVMLFFVGVQLRNNGIHLKQMIFHRQGIIVGIIFSLSSLLGGFISAHVLGLTYTQGLAISAGFGWYSLSSVIIHDAWGAVLGSVAFFNDLSRELLSLFLIPILIKRYPSTAVGISGATALDFNLPVIQRMGGIEIVPFAISFGLITNLLPPLLLVCFSQIA